MDREKILSGIGKLTVNELSQLELAVSGPTHGGNPVVGQLLEKVVRYGLAFKSSGRLKPEVIHYLLEGDNPIVV